MSAKKTLFIASSTQLGGAEKQLLLLIKKLKCDNSIALCILDPSGGMLERYQALGVPTYISGAGPINNVMAIHHALKDFKPDVVVNWLYKADILGGLISRFYGVKKIINSARNTKWVKFARWKMMLLLLAERFAATDIIANAEIGKQFHISYGYSPDKFTVIENFLDADLVAIPKSSGRLPTIGIASRATDGKGHHELIKAISSDASLRSRVALSFVGPGVPEWDALKSELESSGIAFQLHGYTTNLSEWFSSVDIYAALSTRSESDSSSLLDAVLTLTPIISSPIQNLRTLSPTPIAVDPHDEIELADSLRAILDGEAEGQEALESRRDYVIATRGPDVIVAKWKRIIN